MTADEVLGVENGKRTTVAPPRFQRVTSACGGTRALGRSLATRSPRCHAILLVAALVSCVHLLAAARAHAQAPALPGRSGHVDITTADSITRRPLAGARVRLVSVLDTTRALDAALDARGRARVDSLPAGPWVLTVRHARLDTLGVGSVTVPFTVRAGRGVTVLAAVPSARTLVARVCGSAATPGTGYLFGTVRRAVRASASPRATATLSALPLSAGQVTAQWLDLRVEAGRVERLIVTTNVPVGDNGRYVLCGVPTETIVRLRAVGAEGTSGVATLTSSAVRSPTPSSG